MSIRGQNIVCLASQDFDDLWTRKQRWMTRLAEDNRICWVNLQMHAVTYVRSWPEARKRIFARGPQHVRERLWVYTPPVTIPCFQMSTAVCRLHNVVLNGVLRRHLRHLGFTDNLLWLYTPYNGYQIGRLFDHRRVYECVDDFTAAHGLIRAQTVERLEAETLGKVDVTIVTSDRLAKKFAGRTRRLLVSPNAADFEHFRTAAHESTATAEELLDLDGPIIGFVGSISYWVDIPLIGELASRRPDWTFVLVGPVRTDLSPLGGLPNVRVLGQRAYETLPRYVKRFDVCLNPYRNDDVAQGASPLKLYEYLASGKPVVSSDMPEARRFSPIVAIARTPDEFITAIRQALQGHGSVRRERQMDIARQQGWGTRFAELEHHMEQALN